MTDHLKPREGADRHGMFRRTCDTCRTEWASCDEARMLVCPSCDLKPTAGETFGDWCSRVGLTPEALAIPALHNAANGLFRDKGGRDVITEWRKFGPPHIKADPDPSPAGPSLRNERVGGNHPKDAPRPTGDQRVESNEGREDETAGGGNFKADPPAEPTKLSPHMESWMRRLSGPEWDDDPEAPRKARDRALAAMERRAERDRRSLIKPQHLEQAAGALLEPGERICAGYAGEEADAIEVRAWSDHTSFHTKVMIFATDLLGRNPADARHYALAQVQDALRLLRNLSRRPRAPTVQTEPAE